MTTHALPAGRLAERPQRIHPQIVAPSAEPPAGDGKHDGHRLVAIVAGNDLNLISRTGHDGTALFCKPFGKLAGLPPLVLDGEIAVPDEQGITHLDRLSKALRRRRPDQLAYFAFDPTTLG